MKKFIVLLIFGALLSFTTTEKEKGIKWMTLNEALAAQEKNPKKIFIDAYTSWCGWCIKMDKETFSNPDVIEYMNENYYAVKFNAEGNESVTLKGQTFTNPNYVEGKSGRNGSHEISQYFGIRSFPTVLFLDEEANLITPIPGYKTVPQFEVLVKLFATDEYKNIQTTEQWEKYNNEFVPTFTEGIE